MRSRNIEFTGRKFIPLTRLYGFFDGQDVNAFIIPKLLEIRMISGTFQVGELITGTLATGAVTGTSQSTPRKTFRVAQSNHKLGPISAVSYTHLPLPPIYSV